MIKLQSNVKQLTFPLKILSASRPGIITRSRRAVASRNACNDVSDRDGIKYVPIKASKKLSFLVKIFNSFPREPLGEV